MSNIVTVLWSQYEEFLKQVEQLEAIKKKFRELEQSDLHNRDNIIRFFKEVL